MEQIPTPMLPQRTCPPLISALLFAAATTGLFASFAAFLLVQRFQINIVTYGMEQFVTPIYAPALVFGLLLLASPLLLASWAGIKERSSNLVARTMAPLLFTAPLTVSAYVREQPPIWALYLFILGISWSSGLAITSFKFPRLRSLPDSLCIALIFAMVAILTLFHWRIQQNFFEHFMLGHADIGHFTEHLKNALAGRGLRSDSFPNHHFGVHFTPLMYFLVPGYYIWPTPAYLMIVGSILLHLPAVIFYWFSRRAGHNADVSMLLAAAWLLLPSLGRLVYCNTYGFQWTYFSLPLVALSISAMMQHRWVLYWFLSAAVLLCQETFAAIVFGTGAYILLFTKTRWMGLLSCAVAVAYLLLCAEVIIPHFAAAGRFERMDLFGELGGTMSGLLTSVAKHPREAAARLARPESIHLLAILLVGTALAPLCKWRLLIAALPTLGFLLLLQNPEWLSIKFWHHAPVLPILFAGAVYACVARGNEAPRGSGHGVAVAILVAAAWGHYFFGFSPLAKAYAVYANDSRLSQPDPRFAFVEELRSRLDRRSWILATERVAAHFTDFERIYTGQLSHPVDFIVIDRSDTWDQTGLAAQAEQITANSNYRWHAEFGPVIVFQRTTPRQ